ncbi:hypothetical protein [Pseudomonas lini]
MEQRTPKKTLSLRKNIPASNPASTPILQDQYPDDFSDFTYEHAKADASPLEWLEVDEYCSQRKKPRSNKHTHRNEQTRKESRWQ